MKNSTFNYFVFLSLFLLLFGACAKSKKASNSPSASHVVNKDQKQPETNTIKWISLAEAEKLSKKKPRKVMIDVYTDWCGWCKKLDRETFIQPDVVAYVNEHFYAVKLNGEHPETLTFKGKDYSFIKNGMKGYNALAAELLQGSLGYPSMVFLDEKLNRLQSLPGYKDASSLDAILHFYAEDAHKKTSLENFVAQFQSKISK